MSGDTVVEEDWFGRYDPDGATTGGRSGTQPVRHYQHLEPVRRFTLTNKNQVAVQVITYGATVTSIKVPDKYQQFDDVVLGFDKLQGKNSN